MNILVIDDDLDYAVIIRKKIEKIIALPETSVSHCPTLLEGIKTIQRKKMDLVLLDLGLPDSRGIATLRRFRSNIPSDTSVVVCTSLPDTSWAVQALENGALEFLVKGRNEMLQLRRVLHEELKRQQVKRDLLAKVQKHETLISLGKIASSLAHELGNPLDSLRRYIGLAIDHCQDDSVEKQHLLKAKTSLRQCIHVIHQIVNFARDCSNPKARFLNIHHIIDQSIEIIRSDYPCAEVEILKNYCEPEPMVLDRGLILVFRNLIKNSLEALEKKSEKRIKIKTSFQGDQVVISVFDSGDGIPASQRQNLFEMFSSTKEHGLGFGLVLSKEIVEKSGGKLEYYYDDRKESEFRISLPLYKEFESVFSH